VRLSALRWLATRPETPAARAVLAGLDDSDPSVQRAALSALADRPSPEAAQAVGGLLAGSESWSLRRQAAQALERMGGAGRSDEAAAALEAAALGDGYALVRDAAVRALFAVDARAARGVLERVARTDAELGVRASARELLERTP
jgi:HEAT repeat protein